MDNSDLIHTSYHPDSAFTVFAAFSVIIVLIIIVINHVDNEIVFIGVCL